MEARMSGGPKYKISRDWDILELNIADGLTVKEIASVVGVTESCVRHTLSTFSTIDERGDAQEYIDLGLELCDYLDEAGCGSDIDRCMTMILKELWVRGFNTRPKIAKITAAQLEEVLASHRVRRAGFKAVDALNKWLTALKAELKVKKKTKK